MVRAEGIFKSFGGLEVLRGVDIQIGPAEIVSIVGTSGAGKTTLLQIVGTLMSADSGRITIDGTPIVGLNDRQLSALRNQKIGFVFQSHHLLPEFTALENVCLPGLISKTPHQAATKRATELLAMLGLAHRLAHKPSELSGGEQQRVAVARALINKPAIVLADEPSGNLDSVNRRELHQIFFQLRNELSQTFLIVTHDNDLATMSDRVIRMRDGRVEGDAL